MGNIALHGQFKFAAPRGKITANPRSGGRQMHSHVHRILRTLLLGGSVALAVTPVPAADVTPERLVNADKEPQNWLMNHRTYDGQRFSPLARINRDNVKNLRLAYAVPLGGGAGNEFANATPLAEDGFLYVTDSWNVLYKIDARSGDFGRIVWRMDPKQGRLMRSRGAALTVSLVITGAGGFGNPPDADHLAAIMADSPNLGRSMMLASRRGLA
jgi:glucose dehydrogenase